LKKLGVTLAAATSPDHFWPTARLIRQVVGAVAQFEKESLVAKLTGARDSSAALNMMSPRKRRRSLLRLPPN
jgi:hypothetical protein